MFPQAILCSGICALCLSTVEPQGGAKVLWFISSWSALGGFFFFISVLWVVVHKMAVLTWGRCFLRTTNSISSAGLFLCFKRPLRICCVLIRCRKLIDLSHHHDASYHKLFKLPFAYLTFIARWVISVSINFTYGSVSHKPPTSDSR